MAKGIYFGVNGVARKAKKMYFGVNGVARKVKKIYFGVNGVARLAWIGEVPAGQVIFTSSQVWTVPDGVSVVGVFIVGGGGGGTSSNGGGGGGGYTVTHFNLNVTPNSTIAVTVGAGGASKHNSADTNFGGSSHFGGLASASGGLAGRTMQDNYGDYRKGRGGDGGSGGGGGYNGSDTPRTAGAGGSNGSNGGDGFDQSNWVVLSGGIGQGSTTRSFGESLGTLYSGGGGGGGHGTSVWGLGGAGGGGNGGNSGRIPTVGTPNTGGGGGGGGGYISGNDYTSQGGSGIVIVKWAAQ